MACGPRELMIAYLVYHYNDEVAIHEIEVVRLTACFAYFKDGEYMRRYTNRRTICDNREDAISACNMMGELLIERFGRKTNEIENMLTLLAINKGN